MSPDVQQARADRLQSVCSRRLASALEGQQAIGRLLGQRCRPSQRTPSEERRHKPNGHIATSCVRARCCDVRQRTFPSATIGFPACCPLPPKPIGAPRPWTVVDLIAFLGDLEHGDTPSQACRQRRLPTQVGQVATETLLTMGQENLRTGRTPVDVILVSPAAALKALKLRIVNAYQAKYNSWRSALDSEQPRDFPEAVWEAWRRSARGQYVKLMLAHRPDRWMTHILASGMPASKLRVCVAEDDSRLVLNIRRMVRTAMALALTTGGSGRYEPSTYNDRRGHCYLLVADEAEVLTDHTGAAFSTVGLKVVVLAMWLASHAKAEAEESAS